MFDQITDLTAFLSGEILLFYTLLYSMLTKVSCLTSLLMGFFPSNIHLEGKCFLKVLFSLNVLFFENLLHIELIDWVKVENMQNISKILKHFM